MKNPQLLSTLGIVLAVLACATSGVAWITAGRIETPPKPVKNEPDRAGPDLGELMNSLSRRFASLWFAATSGNTPLAEYEVHEIGEVIEEIERIRPIEEGVDVAAVLEGVYNTNFGEIRRMLAADDKSGFTVAYMETLKSCNSCHSSAGHGFIRIKVPSAPPASNRIWAPPPR